MDKELLVTMIGNARDGLVRTAQAVPEDKLNWRPLDNGRPVLDLLGDAAQVPQMVSQMLESHGDFAPSREMFQQMKQEREGWTRNECIERLNRNTEHLFTLIRALPDEELARLVTLSLGGGMTMPLAGWIMMTYRTFTNRYAQINYIQTLYGDFESH